VLAAAAQWRAAVPDREINRLARRVAERMARRVAKELIAEMRSGATRGGAGVPSRERKEEEKGNNPNSRAATLFRLRGFFATVLNHQVRTLTSDDCARLYDRIVVDVAVDTHRNTLAECKTFLAWCVNQRWLRGNPIETVQGRSERRRGKEQLRRWLKRALVRANEGEAGAVAAMVTLVLGLRCSEVVSRTVRDLDDEGRLLWIPESKTETGRRTLVVADMLRPLLTALTTGQKSTDLNFGYHDRAWPREWVQRICREAKVPEVTAHGMRGLHSTLALEAGQTAPVVAAALGHESPTTTLASYAAPGAGAGVRQQRALQVLDGGRAVCPKKCPTKRERAGPGSPTLSSSTCDC
jgi:integrase